MESVGELLAKERKAKGLSIEEISEATKIQPKFIHALEQENFKYFSAPVYLKGFLRTYAQHLGLEVEEILSSYKESDESTKPTLGGSVLRKECTKRLPRHKYLLSGLIIIFIVSALLFYLRQKEKYQPSTRELLSSQEVITSPPSENIPPKTSVKSPLPPLKTKLQPPVAYLPSLESPVEPLPKMTKQSAASDKPPIGLGISMDQPPKSFIPLEQRETKVVVQPEPAEAKEESPEPEKVPDSQAVSSLPLVLTIEAVENTWLRVSADGVFQEDILLRAGRSKEWTAQEKFVLIIGHVAGTRVRLNGTNIPLPHSKTDVLRDFTLTKADLSQVKKSNEDGR
jgi:cytoskeleton protein RodZ